MRLPQTSSLLPAIYLRIIGNHTTRTVVQSPTHIRRGVQYEYVPILEMIFRIVLFENAFESFPIGLIPIYLPQKCMVQSRLMYLTGFITHAQVFHMASHQLTYSHMLDELYIIIFSVLSAKKS